MRKTTKTETTRSVSSSKRSAVWKPTDIHRAGKAQKKSPNPSRTGHSHDESQVLPARPKLEVVAGDGGDHRAPADLLAGVSPSESPTPAEMPVGDVQDRCDHHAVADVPVTDAAQAAGEDRAINLQTTDQTVPDLSTSSAPRKRGRPRKINSLSKTKMAVSSVASTTETPAEASVGDGQKALDAHLAAAVPINHSGDPASNTVFPIGTTLAAATPSPAPKRGRLRKAELRQTPEHELPIAAPIPALPGRLPRQTKGNSEPDRTASDAAPLSQDPADLPVGGDQRAADDHSRTVVSTQDSSAEALGWVNHHLYIASDAATPVEDQAKVNVPLVNGLSDLSPVVAELQELQKKRIFCIKSQMRQSSATLALLRTLLGWIYKGNETENAKINKRARELVKNVEIQERLSKAVSALSDMHPGATDKQRRAAERELSLASNAADKLKPLEGRELEVSVHYRQVILASAQANAPWDILRDEYEERMRDLVRHLPVFPWVEGVRGFAEIGLAKIIGEAGDLSKYDNPAKLWKRLGLAVINGRRQGDPGPGATAEDWTDHGYNPKRRSEIWNIADSLIRAVVRGSKEDPDTGDLIDGYALSYYGEVYLARKAYETEKNENGDYANIAAAIVARSRGKVSPENLEGRLTKKHVDSRARRYVTKRLIKHLWQRWRNPTVPETDVHGDTVVV